jgi:small subunit ribosomal protein S20
MAQAAAVGNKKQLQNRKKSAVKAARVAKRRRVYNLRRQRAVKDVRKEVAKLISTGKVADAAKKLPEAFQAIDKAVKGGMLKKNTAARIKSGLSKAISPKK